jgi:TolB-like protein
MSLFQELKRRNVFRVAIAYVLLGWAVLQGADFLLDLAGAPEWVIRVFAIAGLVGFPFALFFAWAYELTPEGIKPEREVDRGESITPKTRRKLDRLIILFLVVAVGFLLVDRYFGAERRPTDAAGEAVAAAAGPAPAAEGGDSDRRSVAVLPFIAMSSGADDEYFADGLTEEILNSLAQLPELLVTARTSAFQFKGHELSVQEIAGKLGVRHVVEGSVRRSGDRLRVTAQLIRAADGFHLWSENYDSTSQDTIEVQEDIAEQIATALDVVLDERRREAMRRAGLRDVEAFIALQKAYERFDAAHGEVDQVGGLLEANRYFEQVLERVPGYAPALFEHADAYAHMLDHAAWRDAPPGTGQPTVDPLAQAVSDLTAAAGNARNFDERAAIEFDLAVVNSDLRGVKTRLQKHLQLDGCEYPGWLDPMAAIFGYADQLVERLEAIRRCDPMAPIRAFSQSRAALWAGEPERALEIATRARETFSHPWLDVAVTNALLAMGQFETARNEISLHRKDEFLAAFAEVVIAAAAGERARAGELRQAFLEHPEVTDFERLQIHAMLGDREEANATAARVDQRARMPMSLMVATIWCNCGAPFDLEATPNFAAKLQEGGLPWPPRSPIAFPLKGW